MTTRTSQNWKVKPGNFDSLNSSLLFPSSNPYGIPDLKPQNFSIELQNISLVPYGKKIKPHEKQQSICHFFLDDYRFECCWNRPYKTAQGLTQYKAVMTPDFSLYTDYPIPLQFFNIYRNRWVGRLWQEIGLNVIFTVGWSNVLSYEFCFVGIPKSSIVAISTPDLRNTKTKENFISGIQKMQEILNPRHIICYGQLPKDILIYINHPISFIPKKYSFA